MFLWFCDENNEKSSRNGTKNSMGREEKEV
jgi:hypothetical protein